MLSEKPWTIERVMMLLLSMAVCFSIFGLMQGLAIHVTAHEKPDTNSVTYVVFLILSIHGSVLASTAFVLWWCQLDWRKAFGFSSWSTTRSLCWGTGAAVVFLPVGGLLKWLSTLALQFFSGHEPVEQEAVKTLQDAHNPVSRILLIVFAVAIAPVAEEILFRGILYPAVKRLGFPRIAMWSTAILFAGIHLNLPIFVPLVALGVALAMLYERTDNLLAPITAHAVFNTINVVELYCFPDSAHGTQGWFHPSGSAAQFFRAGAFQLGFVVLVSILLAPSLGWRPVQLSGLMKPLKRLVEWASPNTRLKPGADGSGLKTHATRPAPLFGP